MSPVAIRRIAVCFGGGYLPGLASMLGAIVQAAGQQGWRVVGIRDGFDGMLFPERYPDGGLIELDEPVVDRLAADGGSVLGTGARTDPFRVQAVNADGLVEQVDRSDALLEMLRAEAVDALVFVVGGHAVTGSHAMSVAWKLARKGLRCVCIPKSVENDLAATTQPFGYHSTLSYSGELLRHIRIAARDVRRLAVVEMPGQVAGWLPLQAGMAAGADAVLIPEIPYSIDRLVAQLGTRPDAALLVVAEGAYAIRSAPVSADPPVASPGQAPSSPLPDPDYGVGGQVINRAGLIAQRVSNELRRRGTHEVMPLVLDQLVRGGDPSALDHVLAMAYGSAAVRVLATGEDMAGDGGVLLAGQGDAGEDAPGTGMVPVALSAALNRTRTITANEPLLQQARALGIVFGEAG
ncbi:MAG: 6-phosphofructokinase [Halioglobus sp.]|nr:6-phosphofructokinase [Halioglobus sp.]